MNAILSAGTGYANEYLRVFLESAKRHCPDARIFLIVYRKDRQRIEALRKQYPALEPVYIVKKYFRDIALHRWLAGRLCQISNPQPWVERVGRYALDIALERYFIARDLLKAHGAAFSNVLLTDSRDVLFQGDPFSLTGDGLLSGLENRPIGQCPHNSKWIKHLYGAAALEKMSTRSIICSGVTLGPTRSVQTYLEQMCAEIWKFLPTVSFYGGYDQGMHNALIFEKRIPFTLVENALGQIATLGYEAPENLFADAKRGLLQVRQNDPVIVHQFNRRSLGVLDFVNSLYPAEPA